jgi:8-oxo-dGTP diphosphatase
VAQVSEPVADRRVRAAGGVVWRGVGPGREVVLVYRSRYGDWTLPKGKLERAEPALQAAVREVAEETGVVAVPQLRLPSAEYLTGVPGEVKTVDFWSMRMVSDSGREADHEVTEARWVPLADARALVSYANDRGVLHAFARAPRVTAEVVLLRHAHAGSKARWRGPDELRPLDEHGYDQVSRLIPAARLVQPARVWSASPLRCQQTVEPLGLPVTVEPAFDELSPAGANGAVDALLSLTKLPDTSVVCSQGKVIPPLLAALRPSNWPQSEDFTTPKGTGWLLAFAGSNLVGLDRLP